MSERQLQRSVAEYFKLVLSPEVMWFHVPNEGKRGFIAQADFKYGGGLSGVPDFYLSWSSDDLHNLTLWIELKSAKGRLTDSQIAFRDRAAAIHQYWTLCRSLDDVQAILIGCFVPTRSDVRKFRGNAAA